MLYLTLVLTTVPTAVFWYTELISQVNELIWANISSYCYFTTLDKIVFRIRTHNTAFLSNKGSSLSITIVLQTVLTVFFFLFFFLSAGTQTLYLTHARHDSELPKNIVFMVF